MDTLISELGNKLLQSYSCVGGVNCMDGKNLPSRRKVSLITRDLLSLLFPGFFEARTLHSANLRAGTLILVDTLFKELEPEITKSLQYLPPGQLPAADLAPLARSLTIELFEELPRIRELLQTDIDAAFAGDPAALSPDEVIVAYPFVEAIAVQRVAHFLYGKGVPLLPRMMTEWAHSRSGLDIHPGATIGSAFFVDHCTGTVIGETSVIGNNVKLYQGVGLVARSLSGGQALRGRKRHPTLEDRVTVYAGATILGGDTVVGAGSTIGANVFLTKSVPAGSVVMNEELRMRVTAKGEWVLDYQI